MPVRVPEAPVSDVADADTKLGELVVPSGAEKMVGPSLRPASRPRKCTVISRLNSPLPQSPVTSDALPSNRAWPPPGTSALNRDISAQEVSSAGPGTQKPSRSARKSESEEGTS